MEPIQTNICSNKLKSGSRFIAIICHESKQVEILTHLEYKSLYTQKFNFELSGFPKFLSGQAPQHEKFSQNMSLNHILGVVGVDGQFIIITGIQSKFFRHFVWFTDIYKNQKAIDFAGTIQVSLAGLKVFLEVYTSTKSLRQLRCNRGQQIQNAGPVTGDQCTQCTRKVATEILQDCSQNCRITADPLIASQCSPPFCALGITTPGCLQCKAYRETFSSKFYSDQSTYSNDCELTSCSTVSNLHQCPSAEAQAYTVGTGNPICIPFSGTSCQQCKATSNCKFYDNKLCSSLITFTNFEFATPKPQKCEAYTCPDAKLEDFIDKIETIPIKQSCQWKFTANSQKLLKLNWSADGLSSLKILISEKDGVLTETIFFSLESVDKEIKIKKETSLQIQVNKFTKVNFLTGQVNDLNNEQDQNNQQGTGGKDQQQPNNEDQTRQSTLALIGIALGSLFFLMIVLMGIFIVIIIKYQKDKTEPNINKNSQKQELDTPREAIDNEAPTPPQSQRALNKANSKQRMLQ